MERLIFKIGKTCPKESALFETYYYECLGDAKFTSSFELLNDYESIGYALAYIETKVLFNRCFIPNLEALKEYILGVFEYLEHQHKTNNVA